MVANGQSKSLNDLAPTVGGSVMKYTVNGQNYGMNMLGCDDAVSFRQQCLSRFSLLLRDLTCSAIPKWSFSRPDIDTVDLVACRNGAQGWIWKPLIDCAIDTGSRRASTITSRSVPCLIFCTSAARADRINLIPTASMLAGRSTRPKRPLPGVPFWHALERGYCKQSAASGYCKLLSDAVRCFPAAEQP